MYLEFDQKMLNIEYLKNILLKNEYVHLRSEQNVETA